MAKQGAPMRSENPAGGYALCAIEGAPRERPGTPVVRPVDGAVGGIRRGKS